MGVFKGNIHAREWLKSLLTGGSAAWFDRQEVSLPPRAGLDAKVDVPIRELPNADDQASYRRGPDAIPLGEWNSGHDRRPVAQAGQADLGVAS